VLPASQFENFSQSYLANQKIKNFIICSKGLSESGKLLSEIATKSLNITKIFILSGPSFAKEVITGMPTALSLASNNQKPLQTSALFKDTNIRIYYSNNIKTLEVLGVVKNIYAIGAGILEAMKLGENARASFITRCASEMQFMLKQSNLNDQKILSLAGIGDLVLTCSSTKSRNFSFGKKFIFMQSTKNLSKNKTTIEGLNSIMTIKKVLNLNLKDLPILTSIINVIKGKSVKNEVNNLLRRKFKYE
jgi:glycerol-3-phosphate dehydrogenase (NAD(P)+)